MKNFKDLREAVSPAQQAAIAIAKKEKGVKEYGGPKISRADYLKKGKEYHEAKGGEIKIVADTNSRKYKEGEVIKIFPETDKGLNQAMVFQKSVKDKFGVDTKMVRESLDEGKDGIDQHPEVRKRYDAMLKTKPGSYERRRAVRALMNKKKELRREEETDVEEMSALTKIKAKLARAARGPSKKATPAMFRQTGKSARKVRQGAAKSKAYELGRKAREK